MIYSSFLSFVNKLCKNLKGDNFVYSFGDWYFKLSSNHLNFNLGWAKPNICAFIPQNENEFLAICYWLETRGKIKSHSLNWRETYFLSKREIMRLWNLNPDFVKKDFKPGEIQTKSPKISNKKIKKQRYNNRNICL